MDQKKRKVYLALSLIPAAALLLPMFAANLARATCSGPDGNGTWTCTNGTSTLSGRTITIPGTAPATTGGVEASVTGAQNVFLTVTNTKIKNQGHGPTTAGVDTGTGNNVGINVSNSRATGVSNWNTVTGNLSLTMTGDNYVETARGTGILVNNLGLGAAKINISGAINVNSYYPRVEGQDAIEATTHGGGAADVTMHDLTPGSTINVYGGGNGILIQSVPTGGAATGGGNVTGNIGSGLTINVTEGTGVDSRDASMGTGNNGIRAVTQNAGTVMLTTAADINARGDYTSGIFAGPHNYWNAAGTVLTQGNLTGSVSVTNSGNITVDGSTSYGIEAYTHTAGANAAGNVSVINSGVIKSGADDDPLTANDHSDGIFAFSKTEGAGATGTVSVTNSNDITTVGDASAGIRAIATATGTGNASEVKVTSTDGAITTSGQNATGIHAESTVADSTKRSGDVIVTNSSDITTNDSLAASHDAQAILAKSTNGNILVDNSGKLVTNSGSDSLQASTGGAGAITIDQKGTITANGTAADSAAVWAQNVDGAITIENTGAISTAGSDNSAGIFANSTGAGNVSVTSTGANITTTGAGAGNDGIAALATDGAASIDFTSGTVTVAGQSAGLFASSAASPATITVTAGLIDATKTTGGVGAIEALSAGVGGSGTVNIDAASQAHGGWGLAAAVMTGGATQTINNYGLIDALSDRAIVGDASPDTGTLNINNYGTMTGGVTALTSATTMVNTGLWNLSNFADTDGDGARDTLGVAVSDFGLSGNNTVINDGTINLLGGVNAATLDTTGQYVPLAAGTVLNATVANPYNAMAIGGPAQAQILGVQTFNNVGVIDMSSASPAVGDVLVISGGHTPGVAGNGVFVSNGGTVIMDTVLNEGGANAQSDMLVVDSTLMGTGATSLALVTSGSGALTVGNGIPLVEVLNKTPGASADDVFLLAGGRMVSGAYEYDLYHNGVGVDAADGNWYLRSIALQQDPEPSERPETALYVRNMAAANGMFIHTLHDRLGEPQYTELYGGKNQTYGNKGQDNDAPAVWARVVGHRTNTEAGGGAIDTKTDTGLVHLGGDIAHWNDGHSRYHLGVMGAYGRSNTDAWVNDVPYTNSGIRRKASGDVEGYSLGLYGTWYGNDKYPAGPYVDVWGMFNWFDNTVKGNTLERESYKSQGGVVSIEGGYAFIARDDGKRQWMLEPQAQVAYAMYTEDRHVEANGTKVNNDDGDGIVARVGVRMYSRSTQRDNGIQPFVEANVWHYSMNNSLDFNGMKISDGAPTTRYEFKAGLQAELTQGWQVWGHLGGQWGLDGYNRYEGMVGLKCVF